MHHSSSVHPTAFSIAKRDLQSGKSGSEHSTILVKELEAEARRMREGQFKRLYVGPK